MKRLKNLSLFKIALLIALNLVVKSSVLLILSLIYLLISDYKQSIIFISIFILILLTNTINNDFIKYGVVESKEDKYVIVDKVLYKTKVYDNDLEVGDFVKFNDSSELDVNDYDLKHNIKYTYSNDVDKLFSFHLKKYVNNRINSLDNKSSSYIKRIVLNDYSNNNDIEDIGYGFSFYYLLMLIRRKNHKVANILTFIYIILFSFEIKLYLVVIDMILSFFDLTRINKLSIKLLLILLINKNLIFNYSIIVSLLLSLYYMTDLKKDRSYIAIIQSLLFGEVQLFTLFFFNYLIYLRIFVFILSFLTILIPGLSSIYVIIIEFISLILKYINFGVRGKINIHILLIIFILFKVLKVNNQFNKIACILLILITPISNPFKHVTFINVGQGDSALIKGELNKYNVLIDTGSTWNYSKLKKELINQGIYKLDYLIISHSDNDHSGNIDNLLKDFKINEIVTVGKDIELNNESLKYIYLGTYENDNDNSLVYELTIDDYKFLFTGDISKKVENKLLDYEEDIDVLKVSHHGSNTATSNYFVGRLNPKFGIISTSGAYNHPSKEVIDNLEAYYVKIFNTIVDGSITFYFTDLIDFIKTGMNEFVII